MIDTFDWMGGHATRFDDPANWFDLTLEAPAQRAPTTGDTAVFGPGDWTVTGGGQVGTLLVETGARVTLAGTGTESYGATTVREDGGTLRLDNALLSVGDTLTVGQDALLDISQAAVETFPFPPFSASATVSTLALEGPDDGAGGGRVELGAHDIEVYLLHNGNSGSGNDFDPGLGISGSGTLKLSTVDVPAVVIYDPTTSGFTTCHPLTGLDFGALHVGDTATLHYALTNISGNAGYPSFGAIQTAAHGGNVTDPALSGSGVTPQDFTIAPRGGTATYDVALDTSEAHLLQDQAVHIAFQFDRGSFNTGVTLPITGAVLNHADPGFELASGPGSLTEEGAHWTLDLGTLTQGTDPGPAVLDVANRAAPPADALGGSFEVAGDGFSVSGADPFSGLAAGESLAALSLLADTTAPGTHTETITLHPSGSNASGFQEVLPDVTLTVTDLVTGPVQPPAPDCSHQPADHHGAPHGHGHAMQHGGGHMA
jgi:hypothetical protein